MVRVHFTKCKSLFMGNKTPLNIGEDAMKLDPTSICNISKRIQGLKMSTLLVIF